jgi:hypothetical protein
MFDKISLLRYTYESNKNFALNKAFMLLISVKRIGGTYKAETGE